MKFTTVAASLCVLGSASAFIVPVSVRSGESEFFPKAFKTFSALIYLGSVHEGARAQRPSWLMQRRSAPGSSLPEPWLRSSLDERL